MDKNQIHGIPRLVVKLKNKVRRKKKKSIKWNTKSNTCVSCIFHFNECLFFYSKIFKIETMFNKNDIYLYGSNDFMLQWRVNLLIQNNESGHLKQIA